jgi:molybdate/tungstate transport system ATP-binding protein
LFHGSVYKNAAYGVSIRHLPRQEVRARACNALEEVGLSHLLHRRARSLSGGEKQRLAIARALATSPRLLFLDEPTGNCDPESARQVEALIRLKVEQGMTVVMTTHDHALGYRLGDQVVPMHQGHPHPLMVNVIKGKIESRDDYFIAFRCGPVLINCPALQGAYNVAVIPMDDLILSQEAIATSAQNRLKGRVVAVESCEHDSETPESVRVVLDCGILLQALVSHRSVEEMRIVPGALFHLSFKASAVRLY